MISIYHLKPAFQGVLRPLTRNMAAWGITANQVTTSAALLSAIQGGTVLLWPTARWPLLLLPVVLFLRMALNAIDGMLAREHNMKSPFGAFLNELGDVVSDTVLYLPWAVVPGVEATAVTVLVLLAIISEMAGVAALQVGASRRYDGPMGKSDRAFIFGAMGLALGLGIQAHPWVNGVVGTMVLLTLWTIANRVRAALREVGP